jgi:hypothetical protein
MFLEPQKTLFLDYDTLDDGVNTTVIDYGCGKIRCIYCQIAIIVLITYFSMLVS